MKKSIVVFFVVFVSVFLSLSTLHSFMGQVQAKNIPDIDRQQSLPIEMINQQGGSTFDVALQGDYAFVGVGPRLLILNVADTANPVLVSKTDVFSGVVTNVTVDNQHVYLSAGGDFVIVDVQNVANPVVTAVYDMPGRTQGIAISGTTAFVAEAWFYIGSQPQGGGLYTFDVSDPANPSLLDYFDTSSSASDVALAGDYAYVTIEYPPSYPPNILPGLYVFDISDPSAITQVNATGPLADGVTIAGNILYVAAQYNGLEIYDITQPMTPTFLTAHTGPFWAKDVTVVDHIAYVAGSSGGLRLIDVTTPGSPSDLGNYDLPGLAGALKVAVQGNQAFVAYDPIGLHIVDVSDGMNPTETAVYNPTGWVRTMTKAGNLLYLSEAENGIRILNATDLSEVGFYSEATSVYDLVIEGNYAYFVNSSGLHILDISNSTAVTETGYLSMSGSSWRLQVVGNYAYIAGGSNGMRVVDISSSGTPIEAGSFADTPGSNIIDYVTDLTISGTLAYLADSSNGLHIVDISDPMSPSEVVSASVGYINEVEVLNQYAYAFSAQTVHIIDVSNPGSPSELISQTVTTNNIENTLLSDGKLYITEEGGGLRILDLTNPIAPVEVFATELAGYTWGVAVDNGTAFVADGEAGFYIFGQPIIFTDFIYLPTVIR